MSLVWTLITSIWELFCLVRNHKCREWISGHFGQKIKKKNLYLSQHTTILTTCLLQWSDFNVTFSRRQHHSIQIVVFCTWFLNLSEMVFKISVSQYCSCLALFLQQQKIPKTCQPILEVLKSSRDETWKVCNSVAVKWTDQARCWSLSKGVSTRECRHRSSPPRPRLMAESGLADPGALLPETTTMTLECGQRNRAVLQGCWNLLKLQPRWMWLSWLPS